ncbi:hypothetical protein SFRURICE_002571 [Spodoptera frugiperda]|nr:hypothetical protein SFRURICE_002571 [Spodoptera frugiperda]
MCRCSHDNSISEEQEPASRARCANVAYRSPRNVRRWICKDLGCLKWMRKRIGGIPHNTAHDLIAAKFNNIF